MKLDEKRSFAHIYGHASATYEQDGKLFNGAGELIEKIKTPALSAAKIEKEEEISDYDAKKFLQELLDGTPMSRKKVAEVAEQAGISWIDVETAAGTLNVARRKKGFGEMWLLNPA